jgi:CopG family transcriptional regulator / antitoxin EndoAI
MANSTVNISFKDDLLNQIDDVARAESRSRSELIREAARMYIARKERWSSIYNYGEAKAEDMELNENDIATEIAAVRRERKSNR